jgi:5-deoxy-glucuronate isomerase
MSQLVKASRDGELIVRVTPQSAGWSYVGFTAHRMAAAERVRVEEAGREVCLVVLSGTVTVEAGTHVWEQVGKRDSVFEETAPYALYLPPGLGAIIHADRDAEVAVASAPAAGRHPPRLIEPAQMKRSTRGIGANARYVCDILPESEPAEHLLVVEVLTPGGHASSYPPHKHDRDNLPSESALEEIYYHRLDPPQGFAFQRVYTESRDLDETMTVEDHDLVMVPRGYHPVVVPYGYDNYYLNVMAGLKRTWRIHNDPAHEWIVTRDRSAT